jgi:hypothetical protein
MGRNQWFEIWGFNVRRSPERRDRRSGNDGRDAERELAALLRRLSARPLGTARHGRDND